MEREFSEEIAQRARQLGGSLSDVGDRLFTNNRYTVYVRYLTSEDTETFGEPMDGWLHFSIKRNDRRSIREWRHLQRIKNEIAGPDREAVELYPAEDRLVDMANQYHLWVGPVGFRWPIGFPKRMVGTPEEAAEVGARQEAFE